MLLLRYLLIIISIAAFVCSDDLVDISKKSYLWRINTEPPSYMFGTMHFPYAVLWDYIPRNAKEALNQSSHAFFETDNGNSEVKEALDKCQLLPNGQNISQIVAHEVFIKLKQHLKATGMDSGNWERLWPVRILMSKLLVGNGGLLSSHIYEPVLDHYLYSEAKKMNKQVGGLESVDEHCMSINNISTPLTVFALNHTIHHLTGFITDSYNDDLIMDYRNRTTSCGYGHEAITKVMPQPHSETVLDFVNEYDEKINKARSKKMGERVVELLRGKGPKDSYFFAAGIAHFLHCDNRSIPNVVRMGGFTVDQLGPEEELSHHKSGAPKMEVCFLLYFLLFGLPHVSA